MEQPDDAPPEFLMAACQIGAEGALKAEMVRRWPAFRFAFSRPGFLTFKLPPDHDLPGDFDPQAAFARTHAFSLGRASGENIAALASSVWQLAGRRRIDCLQVWQRDTARVGFRGFEPSITPAAREAEAVILAAAPAGRSRVMAGEARPGHQVLDCVLVEPDQWWLGTHEARGTATCWPGGIFLAELTPDAISRAWLKTEEALNWSGLKVRAGECFAEIGCAPGGSSQALLARGLRVIGIDPADVDARLSAHENFTHVRKRGAEVRRREFRNVRWLSADVNAAPSYTLDTVEPIVTHSDVDVRGLLLTLKLLDWKLADELPVYMDRIASWGYGHVRARQLSHNRQEVCVAATRRKRRDA